MPSCADIRGIKSVDYDRVVDLKVEAALDESDPLLSSEGDPECIALYRARNLISVNGKGTLPVAIEAGGSMEVDGLEAGVTFVSETDEEQEFGQWLRWSASATNYPHAVAVV